MRSGNEIVQILGDVTPGDLDSYERLSRIQIDREIRLAELSQRVQQLAEERALRRYYAIRLFWLLVLQTVIGAVALVLIGREFIEIERWVAVTFYGGLSIEQTGMVWAVVRYLFGRTQPPSVMNDNDPLTDGDTKDMQ